MWRSMIYGALMWAVTIYAFRKGGWAEKLAVSGIVVNSYLTVLVLSSYETSYQHVEINVMFVDCGLFALLVLIAFLSRKFWPMWLAAMGGVTILSHLAPYAHATPWVYFRATALWSWPALILLGFGVYRHRRGSASTIHCH